MKIRNYNNPPVGNDWYTRNLIRFTYRALRKAGQSPIYARLTLRSLFTMGEVRGVYRFETQGIRGIKGE